MTVRRRGITPVVSRYILKSRAHARKSRTRNCTRPIGIVEKLWNSSSSEANARLDHRTSHGGVSWFTTVSATLMRAAVFNGFACSTWSLLMRQIFDSKKYRVVSLNSSPNIEIVCLIVGENWPLQTEWKIVSMWFEKFGGASRFLFWLFTRVTIRWVTILWGFRKNNAWRASYSEQSVIYTEMDRSHMLGNRI